MKYIFVSKRQMYWQRFGKPLCLGISGLLVCWTTCGLIVWLAISALTILRGVL